MCKGVHVKQRECEGDGQKEERQHKSEWVRCKNLIIKFFVFVSAIECVCVCLCVWVGFGIVL